VKFSKEKLEKIVELTLEKKKCRKRSGSTK
jgi:hypothetical protein